MGKSNVFGVLCFIISRKVTWKCNWNTHKKRIICAVYGEGTVTDCTSQKWFVKFHARDFLLDDAP